MRDLVRPARPNAESTNFLMQERLELAQEDARDARVVVVPEEIFEKEVEVVEPDAGAGTGPDEAFEGVSAVVWSDVGGVGKAQKA